MSLLLAVLDPGTRDIIEIIEVILLVVILLLILARK